MVSVPTKPPSLKVVLPSIREIFPEHLMEIPPSFAKTAKPVFHRKSLVSNPQQGTFNPGSKTRPRSFSSSISNSAYSYDPSYSQRAPPPHVPHVPQNRPTIPLAPPTTPATRGLRAGDPYSRSPKNPKYSPDNSTYSFGVLRSDPSSSSLQHIVSSTTLPNRSGNSHGNHAPADISNGSSPAFQVALTPSNTSFGTPSANAHQGQSSGSERPSDVPAPSIISFPVSGPFNGPFSMRGHSPSDPSSPSDEGDLSGSNSGKKHICTTCFKPFNRPSSLRIHVNTHTGATPFPCPWPNCGREFNVNSNMRRHLRNHTASGVPRSPSSDNRRRRRRALPPAAFMDTSTSPTSQMAEPHSYVPSPPVSTISISEDSDGDASDLMEDVYQDELESPDDELPSHHPTRHLSRSHTPSFTELGYRRPIQATSSSPSPQPEPFYSPSAPYVRSFADPKVSTALRPAFQPLTTPSTRVSTKDEPRPGSW